jgi:hypothetical protein
MLKLLILITTMVLLSNCSLIRNCDTYHVLKESRAKCHKYQESQWEKYEKRF